jgi:hypothetical protein
MNQRRVSIVTPLVTIATLVGGGLVLGMLPHQKNPISITFLSLLYCLFSIVGIWSLASIHRTANSWNSNVTPSVLEYLPKGTWSVAAATMNRRDPQGSVYVVIEDRANWRALSTLALEPRFIEITDFKKILEGEKPRTISVGQERIDFSWPT